MNRFTANRKVKKLKTLTLPNVGARILESYISARSARFRPRDQRTWGILATKLIEAMGEYDSQQIAYENAMLLAVAEDDKLEIGRINLAIRDLDESVGAHMLTMVLDDADVSFLLSQYLECDIPGDRRWRTWNELILAGLDGATPVTVKAEDTKPIDAPADKLEPVAEGAN